MLPLVLILCCVGGLALYFGVVRPFFIPLSWRIPTGAAYRPLLGAPARR